MRYANQPRILHRWAPRVRALQDELGDAIRDCDDRILQMERTKVSSEGQQAALEAAQQAQAAAHAESAQQAATIASLQVF